MSCNLPEKYTMHACQGQYGIILYGFVSSILPDGSRGMYILCPPRVGTFESPS